MTCNRSVVSLVTPVSSTNKTDCHNTTEILLKVALNTINQTKPEILSHLFWILDLIKDIAKMFCTCRVGWVVGVYHHFQKLFSYIGTTKLIGWELQLVGLGGLLMYILIFIYIGTTKFTEWEKQTVIINWLVKLWSQVVIYRCLEKFTFEMGLVWFMAFNANFNNISVISWRTVLLVEETGVPGENHWPVASHWQTLSHNVVSSTPSLSRIRTKNISGDRHWLHR